MADIIDLASARAARREPTPTATSYTAEQIAHAHRIGDRMADVVNSGRVALGRSPFVGTVEQETALLRRLEAAVERLRWRDAGRT